MGKKSGEVRDAVAAYLDTHVAIWLALAETRPISRTALSAIDRYELRISPMVRLELQYLRETAKLAFEPDRVLSHLHERLDVRICEISFDRISIAACRESWTRDAFDRLIVANARCAGDSYLISADTRICENYSFAIW